MSPLPFPAAHWADEIYEAAKEFFNGELRVIKPGDPGTYDPKEDEYTGGTPDVLIQDWRPARAQEINAPLEGNDGNGWTTRRRFLFQQELRDGDPIIHKGLVAHFRGGRDASLASFAFQVTSAVNSSHAALRTIRAVTEAGAA